MNILKYYKLIALNIILSLSVNASNLVSPLLRCLAQEEGHLHQRKERGPYYQLNQTFVNEISSFKNISLKKNHLDTVCKNKGSTTFAFLRVIVLEGKKAFITRGHSVTNHQRSALNNFLERAPLIFLKHLAQIQIRLPSAHCLEQEVPEVSYFLERFKYLQTDLDNRKLLDDQNKVKRIFSKISNLEKLRSHCLKKANARK